ncbi:MFS transporter [Piscicoccus intestinalis]|uniref:MFS transporter n=1 Tax=Piscicoccus intestinalis TaxID=746033 RepID=UPI001FE11D85|nr:MFS transporter [Piscicoccus intestinalis]
MSSSRSRAWLWGLILAAVLVQGGLNLVRPVTTYKLLALGAGATTTGFVTAAYAVLPLIVALRLGRLTDGTPWLRQLVMASAALLALAGGIVALAPNVAVITIGSALLGLAHLLFTICGQAMIARYSSDADLDLGFGWFTAAYSVGQAAGPLLGGALVGAGAVTASAERLADVDRALWVGALVPLLAVPLLFRVRRRGSHARSARPAEAAPHAPDRASIGDVLRIPGVASHMFASMGLLAMVDILTAFLPIVGERAGVAPAVVGALLAVRAAAGILSRVLLPWMSRRWSRRGLVIASLLVSGLALAVPPLLLDNLLVAGAFLAVGGFFLGIGQPLTMTLVSTAVPVGWRSQALAVRLMGNRVGQVGFPLLAGLVARPFGPGAAVWMTCVVLVLAGTEKLTFGRRAD